jgi:hypothetical protein
MKLASRQWSSSESELDSEPQLAHRAPTDSKAADHVFELVNAIAHVFPDWVKIAI